MTLCKQVKTLSGITRRYNFPSGELVVFSGTKKVCMFLVNGLSYCAKQVSRMQAAMALRQLKRDCKSVTPDEVIEAE